MSCSISLCDECLVTSIPSCDNPFFWVGLTANHAYKVWITNHFGQKFTQNITTDSSGNITLAASGFPLGFFSPYAGIFTMEVTTMSGTPVQVNNGYTSYPCISFDVYPLDWTNEWQ